MPIYHVKFDICNCKLICLAGIFVGGRGQAALLQHMRTFKRTNSVVNSPSPGKAAKVLGQKVAYFKIQLKTDKSLSLLYGSCKYVHMCHALQSTNEIYICNVSCRVQHCQKCKKHLNVISVAINKIIPLLFSDTYNPQIHATRV